MELKVLVEELMKLEPEAPQCGSAIGDRSPWGLSAADSSSSDPGRGR